jgi:hypothetical protein
MCVDMNNAEHEKWSERALEYGLQVIDDDGTVEKTVGFFNGL